MLGPSLKNVSQQPSADHDSLQSSPCHGCAKGRESSQSCHSRALLRCALTPVIALSTVFILARSLNQILGSNLRDEAAQIAIRSPNLNGLPMHLARLAALSAVVAALTTAFASTQSARAENYLCRQQFALCTSAPCI